MLEGYKVWTGLIMIILGWLGIGDIASSEQVETAINLIVQLVGIVVVIYGNYKSHQKIGSLERTLAGRM